MQHFSERLEPQYVEQQRLMGLAFTGVLLMAWLVVAVVQVLIGVTVEQLAMLLGSALLIGATGIALWAWPPWQWRHTSFAIDGDALWIRRGAIWRRIIVVPRSRIQHVDIAQGPVERLYGLATLVTYTAGHGHARVALAGLTLARARMMRDSLLGVASEAGL